MYELIFSLNTEIYEKGDLLIKYGDVKASLIFLQKGMIEVSIITDGVEIVIERLFRGSIINPNTFFLDRESQT